MVRLLALVAVLGMVSASARAAEDVYSFVDSDGVIHVTNVPQDPPLLRRASQYDDHIRAAAERYGLPVPLLKAVMAVESNFDPAAVSGKGATGLMQLMPGTARDMYVLDVHDPGQNIEGGARYLRHLHDQFDNDLVKVLAAYNAGPEAVRRSGGAVPPIRETQAYVRKVLTLYDSYMRGR